MIQGAAQALNIMITVNIIIIITISVTIMIMITCMIQGAAQAFKAFTKSACRSSLSVMVVMRVVVMMVVISS